MCHKKRLDPDTGAIVKQYHTGGIAGGDNEANLKSTEVFAKLMKGEPVTTEKQAQNFLTKTLPALLGASGQTITNNSRSGDNFTFQFVNNGGTVDKTTLDSLKADIKKMVGDSYNAMFKRGNTRNAKQMSI